jgi:hypothetical protein
MTKIPPQFELPAMEFVFNLAGETSADGERLQREAEAAAKRAAEAKEREQKQQPPLFDRS